MTTIVAKQPVSDVSSIWGESDSEKGEVFTKPEVVNFMLNSSGIYDALLDSNTRILEPSCGHGEFVVAIAQKLCAELLSDVESASPSYQQYLQLIRAYDISPKNIDVAKQRTHRELVRCFSKTSATILVDTWFNAADFLLSDDTETYSHIIGNPPYVRIESIPSPLLAAYRQRYHTMIERADIYVAFYHRSLLSLKKNGVLSFICTDRWTKNRYGSALRKFIHQGYQLDLFVDLYGQNAFQSDVMTYPAITQISFQRHKQSLILHAPKIDEELSNDVVTYLKGEDTQFEGKIVRKDVLNGSRPWMFGSPDELNLINRLERDFPVLEEAGCQVFIGAATGNNKVYCVDNNFDIEESRRIPMIKAADLVDGVIVDSGMSMINTYDANGVINLNDFPKLKQYLELHESALKGRHVAKKSPAAWFKTIDRVYPERAIAEKLLIPDIKSQLTVVYDNGHYHPNNSIYYVCSNFWSLRALQAVLLSGIGQMFVEAYSTKISGGNLRFQAQHLRRIRIPHWKDVSQNTKQQLEKAATSGDIASARLLVSEIYNLSEREKQIIGC